MEVVSPDSEARDWRTKYQEYESATVQEYRVIDPGAEVLEAFRLSSNGMFEQIPEPDDRLTSQIVPGFLMRPDWLWQFPSPPLLGVLRELRILESSVSS
jgi:Uma2 family endonuclease